MKKIEAYIQPFMLQKVTDALHQIPVCGMSVSDIKGFGKEKDESHPHHSRDYVMEFTSKNKIEIICNDEETETIIEIIQKNAHTGRRGDGKIIVLDVKEAISIRSGVKNDQAI